MKDGTRKIFAKAVRSLESARELLSEGAVDLAAGRGYYAMLYAAKALLYEDGVTALAHAQIVDSFERELVGAGKVPASYVEWLRDALRRRRDDSDSGVAPTSADVEQLVDHAALMVTEARRLLGAPD